MSAEVQGYCVCESAAVRSLECGIGWHRGAARPALADQRAAADDGLRSRVEALVEVLTEEADLVECRCPQSAADDLAWCGRHSGLGVGLLYSAIARLDAALDPPTATLCTARHDVHEDGVTATWSCQQLGAHGTHKDSAGEEWTA